MRISDWSSDVCSSDLERNGVATRFETSSARAQMATVEALVPELTQRLNTLMNALALLLAEEPRAHDAQLLQAMPDRKSTRLTSSHYCPTRMPYSDCKKKLTLTPITRSHHLIQHLTTST